MLHTTQHDKICTDMSQPICNIVISSQNIPVLVCNNYNIYNICLKKLLSCKHPVYILYV